MSSLTIKQGHTQTVTISVVDEAGDPYDLTGATLSISVAAKGAWRKNATVATPSSGVGVIAIAASDYNAELQPGSWPFEVWVVEGASRVPVASGRLIITGVPQP